MNTANINSLWASLIVEELVRLGVTYFCVSPGSRSAPLTVAAAQSESVEVLMHFDERGAAFHALGYARAAGRPAALICTSGTAAANYLPAIVEASMSSAPMIVLTADRPPELRGTLANQTIDQVKLYSTYVRRHVDMPCPNTSIKPEFVLSTIDETVYRSLDSPAGPVHINCMFREPLAPTDTYEDFSEYLSGDVERWLNSDAPFTTHGIHSGSTSEPDLWKIAESAGKIEKGLIVVGRLRDDREAEAVLKLSRRLSWPILPDILSQLRLGNDDSHLIASYDQMLNSPTFAGNHQAELCLHIGGPVTSKRLMQYLDSLTLKRYIHVSTDPRRLDPSHHVTDTLNSDIVEFCEHLAPMVPEREGGRWMIEFRNACDHVSDAIDSIMDSSAGLTEPMVARLISRNITANTGLFLASSLPIREMDLFADCVGPLVHVAANRGASGIDGTVASASGFASGLGRPVTALIGDLALLHDLNSLALAKSIKTPVVLVVLNNNGGNIFSFLPIAAHGDVFEKYFITPHGYTFEHVARMFDINYIPVQSQQEFVDVYARALQSAEPSLIEITIDRRTTVETHNAIADAVRAKLGD